MGLHEPAGVVQSLRQLEEFLPHRVHPLQLPPHHMQIGVAGVIEGKYTVSYN